MKNRYTVALSGLSEPDARMVQQALESPELGEWSLAEGGNGDLLIIDVDSVWGHMDWLRAASDGRRCAAYTYQESMRDADLVLRKPLDSKALVTVLRSVQADTHPDSDASADTRAARAASPASPGPAPASAPRAAAASAGPEPVTPDPDAGSDPAPVVQPPQAPAAAKPPPAPSQPSRPRDAPDPTPAGESAQAPPSTIGALLLSGDIEAPVMIRNGDGDTALFIDPVSNVYRAPPQLKPLEQLLSLPAARMTPIDADAPEVQHAGPEQPIVRLLWFAALITSHGVLSPHLDAAASWKLTRWPQIEREFPRHFRIATAMMKQAGTLEDVATAANSPVEDVAGFINAYYVAGYVAAVGSDEPQEAANSTASVISRLRRTFSRQATP